MRHAVNAQPTLLSSHLLTRCLVLKAALNNTSPCLLGWRISAEAQDVIINNFTPKAGHCYFREAFLMWGILGMAESWDDYSWLHLPKAYGTQGYSKTNCKGGEGGPAERKGIVPPLHDGRGWEEGLQVTKHRKGTPGSQLALHLYCAH